MRPDLYDFMCRDYHPSHGRWISPDPAGMASVDATDPQTWNRYAYVRNNPLENVDPDGQGIFADIFGPLLSIVGGLLGVPIPPVIGWDIGEGIDVMRGDTPGLGTFLQGMGLGIADVGSSSIPTGGTWGSGQVGGPVFSATIGETPITLNPPPMLDWPSLIGADIAGIPVFKIKIDVTAKRPAELGQCGDFLCNASGRIVTANPIGLQEDLTAELAVVGLAYDISLVQRGRLFGTRQGGNTPLLNSNNSFRVGWSYSKQYGTYVFRIGGNWLKTFMRNPHVNLWPPSWWGGPPA